MIEIKNLTKQYDGETIVSNVSLTIKKGAVFGFMGQNGSGKTTTMKMIVGITKPTSGTVTINGAPTTDVATRETIGFMPEAPYFYDRLTGLEFLKFCGELFSGPAGELSPRRGFETSARGSSHDYADLLKKVGIYDARDKPIGTYSKGMKQRLGFAQALVNNPAYVFLDEPLDGLDPIGRREIKKIIGGLKAEGKTVFFNSHILYDTEELCDEVGIIHEGKLLYHGPVKEFCAGRPLEERFIMAVESRPAEPRRATSKLEI